MKFFKNLAFRLLRFAGILAVIYVSMVFYLALTERRNAYPRAIPHKEARATIAGHAQSIICTLEDNTVLEGWKLGEAGTPTLLYYPDADEDAAQFLAELDSVEGITLVTVGRELGTRRPRNSGMRHPGKRNAAGIYRRTWHGGYPCIQQQRQANQAHLDRPCRKNRRSPCIQVQTSLSEVPRSGERLHKHWGKCPCIIPSWNNAGPRSVCRQKPKNHPKTNGCNRLEPRRGFI